MRFPEPVRMADDDEGASPIWARSSRRRSRGNPIVSLLVTLLALFGALTAVLGIKEQSVAQGGALIDGWISAGWDGARRLAGQAPEAAERAGDALEAGADKTAQTLQQQ